MVLKVATSINGLNGPVYYKGNWDADTNTPTLASGVGCAGEYYIVSVAGNTVLDNVSNWQVGDWAIFNCETQTWEKLGGGEYGTTLRIQNDSSSNTEYNVALTNVASGIVDTEFVDGNVVTYNPSTEFLSTPNLRIRVPNSGSGNVVFQNASGTNKAIINGQDDYHGNGRGFLQIYTYDGSSTTGNSMAFNGYGALGFDAGYGTAGQVLISAGSSGKTFWGNVTTSPGTIKLINDTAYTNSYNVMLTAGSSGSINTAYVDTSELTFKTGYGHGSYDGVAGLTAPATRVNGYLTIADNPTTNKYFAWENYESINGGVLALYSPGTAGNASVENVVFSKDGWLGIGVIMTQYDVYSPLMVTLPGAGNTGPQVIISDTAGVTHGLEISYGNSNNAATINNYYSGPLQFYTNNSKRVTINASGAFGLGTGPSYGNTGEVLISQGSATLPIWGNVAAVLSQSVVTKTANYTATTSDNTILVNGPYATTVTITLPTAVGNSGKVFIVKKIDNYGANTVVACSVGQTIDGQNTYTFSNQYVGVGVQSDGSNWYIINTISGRNGSAGTF